MKNYSNIYDIDGELIREAGDNHSWTAEEANKKIKYYAEKIQEINEKENPTEDDLNKAKIYKNYHDNLMNFVIAKMSQMSQNDFKDYILANTPEAATKTTEEQVENALNDLKNEVEEPQKPVTQEELLVDRDNNATVMDEYVPFEEV